MTIIIEHYPCRHPAMTALIRGAFKTDPSKAQPPRNTVVNTPLGGEPTLGLKATSHSPRGQSTNNSVPQRAFEPPHLPPSAPSLSSSFLSVHPCLQFIKLIYTQEGHLHKLRRINKRVDLWIICYLSMKAEAKRSFCLLVTSDRRKVRRYDGQQMPGCLKRRNTSTYCTYF